MLIVSVFGAEKEYITGIPEKNHRKCDRSVRLSVLRGEGENPPEVNSMKKMMTAAAAALMLVFAGCSAKPEESAGTQIPNPVVPAGSLEEAAEITGFNLSVPDKIEGYEDISVQVISKELIQVIYDNGETDIYIRKAKGQEDISGDWNEYPDVAEETIGGKTCTVKKKDGKVYVVLWTADGYTYSVQSNDGFDASLTETLVTLTE